MNKNEYKVINATIKDTKEARKGNDIYYQCGLCKLMIPSIPDDNISCTCGNIGIDVDLNRLFVEDFSKFSILQKINNKK